MKIPEAAETAGMQYESLRLALKRPHVQEAFSDVRRAWLASETLVAWNQVAHLQRNAASEDIQLKAARTVIGAAGELEPADTRGPTSGAMMVQIIMAPGQATPLIANDRGVIEAEPWHSGLSR
ncbi:hypothetical protein [Brevundimonas sp.]|uniref:hypothetical protein n=1 Tax=Brevundimonas sp. TaxID=1871086 RepID=UPI001A250BD9|nr:hypothetical protein [Brevundimonas sp.]MBJ7484347.1 hypothetical protein [Brevundimonas sp.]